MSNPVGLLAGMAMDAAGTRYHTLDELLVYCHRAAGVVGLMMAHALGVSDDRAGVHAGHLGIAMQLTNIARDVAEDWGRGRLHLPLDRLGEEPPAGRWPTGWRPRPSGRSWRWPTVTTPPGTAGYSTWTAAAGWPCGWPGGCTRTSAGRYGRPTAWRAVVPGWRKGLAVLAAAARAVADGGGPAVGRPGCGGSGRSPTRRWRPFREAVMGGRRESWHPATFGLTLVLATATALFPLVGLNPKADGSGRLPWVYCGLSLAGSGALWVMSGRLGRPASGG